MVTRYEGQYSRVARSSGLLVPTSNIVTTLDYPVTIPGDSVSVYLLKIQAGTVVGTGTIRTYDHGGTRKLDIANGTEVYGSDMRAYYSSGGSLYAALQGSGATAVLWLPDGSGTTSGQQQFAGTGPPSATNIPMAANKGDVYWQGRDLCRMIAESYVEGGGATTTLTVGSSSGTATSVLNGTVLAGDLVVVVGAGTNSSAPTMTIGASSGITATSADGGFTQNDSGTGLLCFYSHVVQPADLISGHVKYQASTNFSGTSSHLVAAMVFRNPTGWPTTGTKFGCPTTGTNGINSTSGTSATPTVSGPLTDVSVSVAAGFQATTTTSPGLKFLWDASPATSDETSDSPGGTNTYPSAVSSRPAAGTNTSGEYPYGPGGDSTYPLKYYVNAPGGDTSQCAISNFNAAAFLTALVNWTPNPITSAATYSGTTYSGGTPIMWICSVGGSTFASQTWVQLV